MTACSTAPDSGTLSRISSGTWRSVGLTLQTILDVYSNVFVARHTRASSASEFFDDNAVYKFTCLLTEGVSNPRRQKADDVKPVD